jgi:hypothetical protein
MILNALYEQLVHLDEQAGCFDEETNARIEKQRSKLVKQIKELEAAEINSLKLIKQTRTMELA